jgi:nicotinamide mononucleotide transporter
MLKSVKANMIKHLEDWGLFEKLWLCAFSLVTIYLYFAWDDTILGLIASLTGMLCVVLVAKGKISNYYPGIINVILYAYIAYGQKYYGEVMLNLLYFLPMQFIGLYLWKKNRIQGTDSEKVKTAFMSNTSRIVWTIISCIGVFIYGLILKRMGGNLPFVDSISTILSIIAMILMAKRYVEQWILWIVVDVVSIIMWFVALMNGGNDISILIMWIAYLVNAIYGQINWMKLHRTQGVVCYE